MGNGKGKKKEKGKREGEGSYILPILANVEYYQTSKLHGDDSSLDFVELLGNVRQADIVNKCMRPHIVFQQPID